MEILLSEIEARVLACLMEKEATTPDYYPMTMNSLVSACNQKSNRNPAMSVTEQDVTAALDELRYRDGVAWQVTLSGSRVPKYKHDIDKRLPLGPKEQAIMCELMLRGPQTVGELRTRTQRLCGPSSADEIRQALDDLHQRDIGPLVVKLSPGHGRRESRFAHTLCGDVAETETYDETGATSPVETKLSPTQQRIADLEEKVELMQGEIKALRETFETFRHQFE
jgi:uncharacterized protein YceH (UPF0502 family)